MGGRWEVLAWVFDTINRNEYHDEQVYLGNSIFKAIGAAYHARKVMKSGCITLRYRG